MAAAELMLLAAVLLGHTGKNRIAVCDLFVLLGLVQQSRFYPPRRCGRCQHPKMRRLPFVIMWDIPGQRPKQHFFHPIVSTLQKMATGRRTEVHPATVPAVR